MGTRRPCLFGYMKRYTPPVMQMMSDLRGAGKERKAIERGVEFLLEIRQKFPRSSPWRLQNKHATPPAHSSCFHGTFSIYTVDPSSSTASETR